MPIRSNTISFDHDLNPAKFYAIVEIARSISNEDMKKMQEFTDGVDKAAQQIDQEVAKLARANNAMLEEVRHASRRKNPFSSVEEQDDAFADLRHTAEGTSFIRIIFEVMRVIQAGYRGVLDTARGVTPGNFILSKKRYNVENLDDADAIQGMSFEFSLNSGTLQRFLSGVLQVGVVQGNVIGIGAQVTNILEQYHNVLRQRHSVQGIEIHGDPVTTDVAMSIFENVDAHGEVKDGKKPDEVSAYSIRKAKIVADAIKEGMIGDFIRRPDRLLDFMVGHLTNLWALTKALDVIYRPVYDEVAALVGPGMIKMRKMDDHEFGQAVAFIKDLDPRNITYKEKTGLMSPEEKYALDFSNQTIKRITVMLTSSSYTTDDLISYVLGRKAELRDFYRDENSFYTCVVGAGNPFLGEAPGALSVKPGTRPVVNLDEIIGSGFAEIKGFMSQVEHASKWHDLFVATSPSRTGDKSNVLLIGPQGCGKSEILRAVGGDKGSIGVFATGSDFLTCWKGEAEKNPKRLFEECLRLQKESGKHVHILIDEIDTILNKDSGREAFGGTNLVTEFQNLMDGVVHYPHISVWGATNHPQKIPMPMMRRFAKVAIVGELMLEDRVKLLKHFTEFMPTQGFAEADWIEAGEKLDGAVGDVLRKIVDHVWRVKMTQFVEAKPKAAEETVKWLNEGGTKFSIQNFDSTKRNGLHDRLRKAGMAVMPEDLHQSVETHLTNVAIHHEIRSAKATYAEAKEFLLSLRKGHIAAAAQLAGARRP